MDIIFLIIGLVVGAAAAFVAAKYKFKSSSGVPQGEIDALKSELMSLSNEKSKAEERSSLLAQNLEKSQAELEAKRKETGEANSDISRLNAVNENLEKRLQEQLNEQKAELENIQKKFSAEFENLANRILDDKSKKFTEQNRENIGNLLDPLKQKISDVEKRVNEINRNDTIERASLAEQLKSLNELNRQMSEDATNLTRALKGDTKAQGNWGEFILESILEKSGLERGREFSIQETHSGEDGSRLRPDVIINLPEGKNMVIDSKVSLVAYELYCSTDSDEIRAKALAEHVGSIKRHIKGLSPKEYQNLYSLQSLDFVLMFIPIEPAFALAVQNEPNIFNEAFDKNIVIVSPSTLLATLRTVASIWKQEKQNRNAVEIARQSGALYDKFVGFVDDLINIGKRLDSTKESYQDAMKKLYEGSGNLVKRAENIKQLGAKASKNLPGTLLDRAAEDDS